MIKNLLENYPFHGFTNEFPRIIRRFGIPWNEHIYTTPWRDKEVVVNALTLICQEFCRTRTCGETREERQLEEPLSHTTLWKACCTRTNTLVRAIHLTRQPDNAFRTVSRIGSTSCQNCLIVCRLAIRIRVREIFLARSTIFNQEFDRRICFFGKKRIFPDETCILDSFRF